MKILSSAYPILHRMSHFQFIQCYGADIVSPFYRRESWGLERLINFSETHNWGLQSCNLPEALAFPPTSFPEMAGHLSEVRGLPSWHGLIFPAIHRVLAPMENVSESMSNKRSSLPQMLLPLPPLGLGEWPWDERSEKGDEVEGGEESGEG